MEKNDYYDFDDLEILQKQIEWLLIGTLQVHELNFRIKRILHRVLLVVLSMDIEKIRKRYKTISKPLISIQESIELQRQLKEQLVEMDLMVAPDRRRPWWVAYHYYIALELCKGQPSRYAVLAKVTGPEGSLQKAIKKNQLWLNFNLPTIPTNLELEAARKLKVDMKRIVVTAVGEGIIKNFNQDEFTQSFANAVPGGACKALENLITLSAAETAYELEKTVKTEQEWKYDSGFEELLYPFFGNRSLVNLEKIKWLEKEIGIKGVLPRSDPN